jgi:hypothetical protein
MYILYQRVLHIIQEPLLKNRCHQTWRGKQLYMCESKEPLQEFIDRQDHKEQYYIEEQPHRPARGFVTGRKGTK